MPLLDFTFDDLPLITLVGFEAGEVAGSAELTYSRDGSWGIHAIALDGTKRRAHTEVEKTVARIEGRPLGFYHVDRKLVPLERSSWLFTTIAAVLEDGKFASLVQDAVRERLCEDYEAALDQHADDRRELRRERRIEVA